MKVGYGIALATAAGALVGGSAVETLHAQAKPPIYMVAVNEVSNQDGYAKEYLPDAQKAIKDHGGVYVAAGSTQQVVGAMPSGRGVILKLESMDALLKWRNSPEYQAALKKGEKYAKYNIIAIPGVQPK
jgi:uncharacterized protein (DUF1330 family)